MAAEFVGKAARLHVRTGSWEDAIGDLRQEVVYRQEAGTSAGQAVMGLVLIELKREDVVAAEKVFKELGGFMDGGQVQAASKIFQVGLERQYYFSHTKISTLETLKILPFWDPL